MLELGMTFSLEQLVIDNDIITMIKTVMAGIPVNDETLGLEAIQKVGIGNNFLGHKTTLNNIDLVSDPNVMDRDMLGDWKNAGSKDLATVAHERVLEIMKTHKVKPIPADKLEAMKAVVDKADKDFKLN